MIYKTHVTFAMALSFSPVLLPNNFNILQNITIEQLPFILLTIFLFSLFPDLDEPNSYLSKRMPWIIFSLIISKFTVHRGVTHRLIATITAPILMYGLLYSINKLDSYMILIYFSWIAYTAHLIGDGFTKGGLRRFYYPLSKSTIWFLPKPMRFKTGSFVESIWLMIFSGIVILESFYLFKMFEVSLNF